MTDKGAPQPIIDADDRVNTGVANAIDIQCMYNPSQYAPFSGIFKPDAFDGAFTDKEREAIRALSSEEKNDGIASKKIYTLRCHNPIDPFNSTHENLRRRGKCDIAMTRQFKLLTLGFEIGRRLIAESRGDIRVDDKEMTEAPRTINYFCQSCRRPCWCRPDDDDRIPLLDQLSVDTPLPLTNTCPFGRHEGRCFCLHADDESTNFPNVSVDDLNREENVEAQKRYLTDCGVPCQELDAPSPFDSEDEPTIIFEMIPRQHSNEVQEGTDIPLAVRFIYIIPENSTVSFGGVVQTMIAEYGSKKRKTFKPPNQYQQHRTIKSRHSFLHLVGALMWGKHDQYTNPQVNKDCPMITSSEDMFVKGLEQILNFEHDLCSVRSSTSSVDKRAKNWQDTLHKDTASYAFALSSYFRGGKFCPTMQAQRNMLILDSELLELKNDHHVVLKKYNLWHYLEQKEYYDRRFNNDDGAYASNPANSNSDASSGILRNPQSMTSELASNTNSDLFSELPELHQNRIRSSVRRWEKGQEGAGLNTFRYRQKCDLVLYEDAGRHLTTNEERRKHYAEWIETSVKSFKRYSSRQDLFLSTRGALDFVKDLKGWNPLVLGFKKLASPTIGVGDMFVAELFYVSETLFYVSTHTGIVYFCFVCTADAFCTRLNKNNWIFKGSPDGGKSYTSNKVKDAMLILATIMMKTKQSDAAMDDIDSMDYRWLMEEANMQLWYKNPKYTRMQDEEKNRLTSGVSIAVKKQQFKGMDDIVRWHTRQIITIQSMQIGCSTNETQLEKKCIKAMISRVPPKDMPKIKRIKGRRAISDMNSAQSQQSASKKRRSEQFSNKYRYYDSLRFLIYKCVNLGILTQPTRTAFDLTLDKLKAYLKGLGISLDSRTEDRCYGKAVSIMILRVITTLFEFPKPDAELMIVAVPFSDTDPWTLKDEDFDYKVHEDDAKRIIDGLNVNDNFEDIRFVDVRGQVVHKLFVKMGCEKAYDENDKCIYQLRTIQQAGPPKAGKVFPHCPESLVGEFYRQWVSIHHGNFEHFVKCVSPLMTISLEDTVRAIWLSRSEFVPDKFILFQKLLLRLGINCLKKDVLRETDDEKKRKAMFKTNRVEVSEDSEYNTNYSYIKVGSKKEVVGVLASDNSGKSEESNTYPEGFEVYFDKLTINDMLEDFAKVKETEGYYYKSPSRINDNDEAFWGVVNVRGELPQWDRVGPDGIAGDSLGTGQTQKWRNYRPPSSFSKRTQEDREDCAKAAFAVRQREDTSCDSQFEQWTVSKSHSMPIVEITESAKGGFKDSSTVYLNINWIEKNYPNRDQKLEDVNPLILFFQTLGYRYDDIPITPAQKEVFVKECTERFNKLVAGDERNRALYEEALKKDLERLEGLVIAEGQPDSAAGLKILVASPFLGYTVDEDGEEDERTCTPQLSRSVTIHHKEVMWFTEAANVPSAHAADMLNLPKSDAEKKRVDLVIPINNFATMTRMDFLCILEDGSTVQDYKALYNLRYRFPRGDYYPYRFASPNYIKEQIHAMYEEDDYSFTTAYPHDAAWHEEKSYDCKRVLVNGQWVWVKYNFLKEKRENNNTLRDEMRERVDARFGRTQPVVPQAEADSDEVEQHLNNLLLVGENPELEVVETEVEESRKRLRSRA